MAVKRFIKCSGQNDVLFRKICVDDCSSSTTLIVPDTHNAIILRDGIALDTLSSGRHLIFDKRKSVLGDQLANAQTVDVIFVSKTAKLNILWGTTTQYDMRDPITGVAIKLGASGEFEVQISNPRKAYLELIGQLDTFNVDNLKDRLLGRLLAEVQFQIANIMKDMKLSYDRLGEVLLPVSNAILPHVSDMFNKDYGLKIFSFTISRIIITEEDIEKINKARSAMAKRAEIRADMIEKERLSQIDFDRTVDLKRLEKEDYAKYLEVCKAVGWPTSKKSAANSESTRECPNCGIKLAADAKFCPVCGNEIVKMKGKCPNCGKMVSKDDLFCKHCGAKIGG